jgi:hypothetical protein
MMDLMYFGYFYSDDAAQNRQNKLDFNKEVTEKFPNVELRNADDEIKGYRYEVWLSDETKDDYLSWLIGAGWLELSLTMQLLMIDKEQKAEFERIWALAKSQYPKSFKPEALKK